MREALVTRAALALLVTVGLVACGSDLERTEPSSAVAGAGGSGAAGGGGQASSSTAVATSGAGGVGGAPLPELPLGIYPVDGYDTALPDGDLAPFGDVLGDVPVIGLGESIHTSGGFYGLKGRLIRYLIEKKGYRVFAIENPRSDTYVVGDYVATCEGGSELALQSLFGVWASVDMLELMEWMCMWNQSHAADPVQFVGFDAQQPWKDIDELEAFLGAADPVAAPALLAGLGTCNGVSSVDAVDYYNNEYSNPFPYEDYAACLNGLLALDQHLSDNETAITAQVGPGALELGRIASLSLSSWQTEIYYFNTDLAASYEVRDLAMAEIFLRTRALSFPDKKVVLWAHNYHLTQAHTGVFTPGIGSALTMGTAVKESLGDDYAAIALIGYDVGINWPGVGNGSQGLAPAGSVEALLHGLGRPALYVDLQEVFLSNFLDLGVPYDMGHPTNEVVRPEQQYRGAFFLDVSPGMDAVFW